jgi:uncharacterized protein YfdQ (DUF2303 family)
MDLTKEAIEELMRAGGALTGVVQTGGDPVLVLPPGYKIENIAALLPPTRVKQNVRLLDAGSFCDYVNRFKNADTIIVATLEEKGTGPCLKAVIDYHGAPPEGGKPRAESCSHTAMLELVTTPDWVDWLNMNRREMTQVQFAEWLEEHQHIFNGVKDGALKGAQLLELVLTLTGKNEVNFTSAVRLQNGANSLQYDEVVSVQGGTKPGKIDMPGVISAALQPYHGGPVYQVDARLKTRIEGRKLTLKYETIQLQKIVRDSILDTVKQVAETTGIIPFIGGL